MPQCFNAPCFFSPADAADAIMLLYGVPAQTPLVENADLIDEEAPPVVRFEKQLIGAAAAHLLQPETLLLLLQPVAGRQRIVVPYKQTDTRKRRRK